MSEKHIFIVWGNALRIKEKVIKTLSENFLVKKSFYVKWSNNFFLSNLMAFYGGKMLYPNDKALICGKRKFLLIYLEDPEPDFQTLETSAGMETVNSNTFRLKTLFRSWCVGGHSIHCSNSTEETAHDLTVLFGHDYETFLEDVKQDSIYEKDTKGVVGFENKNDLLLSLRAMGNCSVHDTENGLYIFAKSKEDVNCFLGVNNELNEYVLNLNNGDKSTIRILGELENEVSPSNLNDEAFLRGIVNEWKVYLNYLEEGKAFSFKGEEMDFHGRKSAYSFYPKMSTLSKMKFHLKLIAFKARHLR